MRNMLMAAYSANPRCDLVKDAVRVRRAVEAARRDWIKNVLSEVNAGGKATSAGGRPFLLQAVCFEVCAHQRDSREVEVANP